MKTELEKTAHNYAKQFDYAEDSDAYSDFIEGAKWQKEKISNSIEQVIKEICKDNTHLIDTPEIQEIIKYFKKQNK